jgi:hypothetical protein
VLVGGRGPGGSDCSDSATGGHHDVRLLAGCLHPAFQSHRQEAGKTFSSMWFCYRAGTASIAVVAVEKCENPGPLLGGTPRTQKWKYRQIPWKSGASQMLTSWSKFRGKHVGSPQSRRLNLSPVGGTSSLPGPRGFKCLRS